MTAPRRHLVALALVALAALSGAAVVAALPHVGVPVALTLTIADGEVFLSARADPEVLGTAFGYDGSFLDLAEGDPGERDRAFRFLAERFREEPPVRAPEQAGPARLIRLDWIDDPGGAHGTVELELALPLEEPARSVSLVWRRWEGVEFEDRSYVPVLVLFGEHHDLVTLTPEEPEHVWHPRELRPRGAGAPPAAELAGERRSRELPLLSAALAAGAAGVLIARRRVGLSAAAAAGLATALATGAVLVRDRFLVPLGGRTLVTLPSAEQAARLFDTLHRNVYAAFDAEREDEIYDLLAASVDARLLDELYGQVWESLVLRDEGGAVCEVEEVEVLASFVTLPEDPDVPRFEVDHEWRVHGLVAHWGHVHRRVNHYRATYAVRHDGESWKIAAVTVHEQSREDPDAARGGRRG